VGFARVALKITRKMSADDRGLAHGGFIFGLADYAAMLAVNHPNVVLGSAQMRFLKPAVVGDTLTADAVVHDQAGKKKIVTVDIQRADEAVARGEFICFTPDEHVLGDSR
jgi:acyl-coenzyme A thioesterase PaaI-like protein